MVPIFDSIRDEQESPNETRGSVKMDSHVNMKLILSCDFTIKPRST